MCEYVFKAVCVCLSRCVSMGVMGVYQCTSVCVCVCIGKHECVHHRI